MQSASIKALVALVLFCGLTGCGYGSQTTFREDVRSVAVPIFENRTFYRGLEFDITEAVVKSVASETPYAVVDLEQAQTVLEGRIVSVDQARLSRTETGGFPQEVEMRVVMNLVWRDRASGKVLMDRQGLMVVGRYVPPLGEQTATGHHEAARRAADAVVAAMRGQW